MKLKSVLTLLCCAIAFQIARGEESAEWPQRWCNAVAVSNGVVYASSVDGLLLRESSVVSFAENDPTKVAVVSTHPVSVWAVEVSGDGKTMVSSDYKGNLSVYNLAEKKNDFKEGVFERWTRALAFSGDGQHLIAGNEAGKVFAYDIAKGEVSKSVELDGQQIFSIAVAPGGASVAVSDGGGHVHVLKFPELESIRKIALGSEPVWGVEFTADGKHLIAGGADRQLKKVAVEGEAEPTDIGKTTDWVTSIVRHPASDQVAVGTMNGTMYTTDGTTLDKVGKAPSGIWAVGYTGSELLAATRKHMVATFVSSWKLGYAAADETFGEDGGE